jgi:guanylate kinase
MISDELIAKVSNYTPSLEKLADLRDTSLLFMVGISGAGKNAITTTLLADYPDTYTRFVTHTTRQPRENHGVPEQAGREYYFISFDESQRMLDDQDYVEANVYSGNVYGTSIAELKRAHDQHKILVSDIDVNGVAHIMQLLPSAKPIFILPPDFNTWQQRFVTRYNGDVDEEDRHRRMHTAYMEIVHALAHDYFYLVVNDNLQEVTSQINDIARGTVTERQPASAVASAEEILQELRKII